VSYKKIYENYDFNFNIASSTTTYRGAIREYGKKIYKINPGTNTEGILYNFNLNVGDTAKSITYYGAIAKKKVTGLSFIVYNNQVHKKWLFQDGEYWLEGIGSSYGLFNSLFQGFDICYDLVCMSIDGTVQYQNMNTICSNTTAPYNCDGGFVSVNELSLENAKSFILPNPFSDSSILKTSLELNDATLKVYDITGNEVLMNTHLNGQEIKITKGHLGSGSYYYNLSDKGNLIAKGKFIIE